MIKEVLVVAAAILVPVAANADVTEITTNLTTGKIGIVGTSSASFTADNFSTHAFGRAPDATAVTLDVVSSVGPGGFFDFEHNLTRRGGGTASIDTVITDLITNTGGVAVKLRLDSLITAGHLSNDGFDPSNLAGFDFLVQQDGVDLYSAYGKASPAGASIVTSDGRKFAGLTPYTNATLGQYVLDWSATLLNLNLFTIAAGATSTITYSTHSYASGLVTCTAAAVCQGTQVAFGDPKTGVVVGFNAPAEEQAFSSLLAPIYDPVVGLPYFQYANNYFRIVDQSAPLPEAPPLFNVPVYGPSAGVPEPAAWALMVAGFGLVGGFARRQRSVAFVGLAAA